MSRTVLLRPIAKVEFDEAVNWFEGKRVGLSFTDAVRDTIRTISESPLMY